MKQMNGDGQMIACFMMCYQWPINGGDFCSVRSFVEPSKC